MTVGETRMCDVICSYLPRLVKELETANELKALELLDDKMLSVEGAKKVLEKK